MSERAIGNLRKEGADEVPNKPWIPDDEPVKEIPIETGDADDP